MANESLYTPQEKENLETLQNNYLNKKAAYEAELSYNTQGHVFVNNGNWTFPYPPHAPTDETSLRNWLAISDAALPPKKASYEAAKKDYYNEVARLETKYTQTFNTLHPEQAALMQENLIKGKNEQLAIQLAAKNDADRAAAKENYASSNTKYILIGVVVLVIFVGVFYFATRPKKAAA
jgi:hypothetical protein